MAGIVRTGIFPEKITPFLRKKMDELIREGGEQSDGYRALALQYCRSPLESEFTSEQNRRHWEAELAVEGGPHALPGLERLYRQSLVIEPTMICAAHCRYCLRGQYNVFTLTEDEFVPAEERFYAGGSYSVRGYSRNMLGPLDETGSPTGGLSLAEASVELRISLVGSLGFVSFLDGGNVWKQTLTYKLDEIAYALGAGLRYDTPVGPVRFDAAKSLTDGGVPWQFHFSIGQAF